MIPFSSRSGAARARSGLGSDGYRVEARIVIWEGTNILKIPASALFRRGDAWSVFALEGGRAHERRLAVGHRTPFEAEILSGLAEGDVVLAHPSDRVSEGVRVKASAP